MHLKKNVGKSKSSSDDANIKETRSRHKPLEDDEDEDGYGPPITLEELNYRWNQYLSAVGKDWGYDVECFPPTCQFATFMRRPRIKLNGVEPFRFAPRPINLDLYQEEEEEDDDDETGGEEEEEEEEEVEKKEEEEQGDWLYNKVKEGAELVINDINAKSTDGTYRLEDLDRVIWSTNFTTLMTLMTTKVVAGTDADRPVAKTTFQATVSLRPVEPIAIISYRVKPVPGVENVDNFRYKNPTYYHT